MIGGVFLAATDLFEQMFASWEQFGIFTYLLPFLLIFALVFGILTMVDMFKNNKAVNAIIAVVVGLMSLQFKIVPQFFAEIFPRLGIGLIVILVVMIVLGIFLPKDAWVTYALFGIGVLVLIIVLVKTAGAVGWQSGQWWADNWPGVAGAIFILVLVAIVVGASGGQPPEFEKSASKVLRNLFGTVNK